MATATNHWKLGLFVIVGLAFSVVSLIVLGARSWGRAGADYVSYFNESVQGLELGAPVKFRGVTVGHVAAIEIAPDQRHIQVASEIDRVQLERLQPAGAGTEEHPGQSLLAAHPDLRVQLAQAGITGVKFVLLDYFDGREPTLPFPVPRNYIPATPSLLQSLENSVTKSAGDIPELTGNAVQALDTLNAILTSVDQGQLPARALATFEQANQTLRALQAELTALNAAGLSKDFQRSLVAMNGTLTRANQLLDRLDSERGLIDTAQRSLGALGEVARGGQSLGGDLESTLHDVRAAARSIQRFMDALERDPDMLLKGRAAGAQ